jgi:hypothetical protein
MTQTTIFRIKQEMSMRFNSSLTDTLSEKNYTSLYSTRKTDFESNNARNYGQKLIKRIFQSVTKASKKLASLTPSA